MNFEVIIFLISQMYLWLYCTWKKVDMIKSVISSLYLCILFGLYLMFWGLW